MTEQAKTDTAQTQLVVIEPSAAVTLFTEGDGIDAMLADIRKQAASLVPDVTTTKGRKEIASVAYAVAKTKTYLDGLGKDLTAKYKEIPARIDANRKLIRDTLDALKDEVRAPLTQFEAAEAARVATLQARLTRLNELGASASVEIAAANLQAMLQEVEQTALDDSWQELLPQATVAKELATKRLGETLDEAEQAELEELRKKQAEQDRIDRERLIAEQAAEQARLQEENRQRLEREAAQHREQEAQRQAQVAREREEQARRDAETAELARRQAEANAKRQAEEAAARATEIERQRIEQEQRQNAAENARRVADREHCGRIHSSILMDLMGLGIEEDKAINLIKLIASHKIANLAINY
ncbi:coiled-coil domain-containing protein [Aeromonas popoffii]|uniref:hypothetical protein n=1 Tax=Aeromonas popoffii TaxID=70856 RepID=UPI0005AB1527|nr:hypothetical protein [Aeromonas popoffii]